MSFVPPSVTNPLVHPAPNNTDQHLLGMLKEPKRVQKSPNTSPPKTTTPLQNSNISDKSPSTQIKQMVGAGSGSSGSSGNIYSELMKQLGELDGRDANKGKHRVYVIQNNSIKVTVDVS